MGQDENIRVHKEFAGWLRELSEDTGIPQVKITHLIPKVNRVADTIAMQKLLERVLNKDEKKIHKQLMGDEL